MENFDWTKFTIRIAVKAKLEDIYNAWTKASEIEKWFLSDASFTDENKVLLSKTQNALKGDRYKWIWYLYDDIENGTVTEANSTDYFQFTFAGACLVEIKLHEEFEYTVVELTQKNIPEDDHSKRNIRLGCHSGWSFYLVNLKSVYEGGLDLRNKDNRFKPMLNN
ncbi:SRPBCC domain-containing protein [Pedobacter sp. MR2016-19]|uniref:SRPBCC family protein n=1 Tax=Pedobacter sp. MR2016-19 TaxID=2780089 RepID=UPI0018773F6D|nr:SRPBCC domain-containing protein [Pedobacter sp. MR2016-19]MBE5320641.1 SRPBCC domain-containing protein [Pedobacter sp. MR2016-19]